MIKIIAVPTKNENEEIAIAKGNPCVGVIKSAGTGMIAMAMIGMAVIGSGVSSHVRDGSI